MEQISKDDLLELIGRLDREIPEGIDQWPDELQQLHDLLIAGPEEAEQFASDLSAQQKLDRLISDVMSDVPVPTDLAARLTSVIMQEHVGPPADELVQPRVAEVHDTDEQQPGRRGALQLLFVMSLVIFGLAMWPLVVPDGSQDVDVAEVQNSIEPWFAEVAEVEQWHDVSEDSEWTAVVRMLQQHLHLGDRSRFARLADGQLVIDFSSPRNGKVVVFVLRHDAPQVAEPSFDVLQVSGPFAAAMGRIDSLQFLVVTNESMKRISEFWAG